MISHITLVKINQVVGHLYQLAKPADSVVIYLKGGPSLGDDGNSILWPITKKHKYDLFIPDYIGYCRSAGDFNFKSCVNTISESENFIRGKAKGLNTLTGQELYLNYKNIILVGSSWGGAIAPFINKYGQSSIQTVILIKPVTDWSTQGKTSFPEENTDQTNQYILNAWLNIYHNYQDSEWPKIFKGLAPELNPIEHSSLLKNNKVIIIHGKQDETIHYSKSQSYYQTLQKNKVDVQLKLLSGNHSSLFNTKALDVALKMLTQSE